MARAILSQFVGRGQLNVLLLLIIDKTPNFEVWIAGNEVTTQRVATIENLGTLNGPSGSDFITREIFGQAKTHPGDTEAVLKVKALAGISRIFFRGLISATSKNDYWISLLSDGNEMESEVGQPDTDELYPQISRIHYIDSDSTQIFDFSPTLSLNPNPADADAITLNTSDWRKTDLENVFNILGKVNPVGTGLSQLLTQKGNTFYNVTFDEAGLFAGPSNVNIRAGQQNTGAVLNTHQIDISLALSGITPLIDCLIASAAVY